MRVLPNGAVEITFSEIEAACEKSEVAGRWRVSYVRCDYCNEWFESAEHGACDGCLDEAEERGRVESGLAFKSF